MFNIQYEDESNQMVYAWQNSWGLTTRTIGILIMVHGDNKGLVLPPKVAPIQVVIIPIFFQELSSETREQLVQYSKSVYQLLRAKKIRTNLDDRPQYSPGNKFNQWELKGIPIRIEIGPKDLSTNSVVVVRRDNLKKTSVNMPQLFEFISQELDSLQKDLLERATIKRDGRISKIKNWDEFMLWLDRGNLVLCPWCLEETCEETIKEKSGESSKEKQRIEREKENEETGFGLSGSAKSLCIPLEQDQMENDTKCFSCGKEARKWTLFGRSY